MFMHHIKNKIQYTILTFITFTLNAFKISNSLKKKSLKIKISFFIYKIINKQKIFFNYFHFHHCYHQYRCLHRHRHHFYYL